MQAHVSSPRGDRQPSPLTRAKPHDATNLLRRLSLLLQDPSTATTSPNLQLHSIIANRHLHPTNPREVIIKNCHLPSHLLSPNNFNGDPARQELVFAGDTDTRSDLPVHLIPSSDFILLLDDFCPLLCYTNTCRQSPSAVNTSRRRAPLR